LRTQHFPQLETPALFVQGTRDPFGSEEELSETVRLIPARTSLLFLAGAGHDLKVGKSVGATLPAQLLERFVGFFGAA